MQIIKSPSISILNPALSAVLRGKKPSLEEGPYKSLLPQPLSLPKGAESILGRRN